MIKEPDHVTYPFAKYMFPFTVSLSALLAANACLGEQAPARHTLRIEQSVGQDVQTVVAPDNSKYYSTLNGTHFSYRCYDPYTAPSKQAAVEVCEIAPVDLKLTGWPETEVIHLISGQVDITELGGEQVHYSAGDIFVLPQGFKGLWQQKAPLTKVTVRHPLFWKE
ncbi:cupin domain-containing protein [Pseudomonas sp. KNUC1026]|uniref:cupin domain-containing protein n=1 Tax=Pseudomonas sp. KNUC1026 TaxID=2893890 RepID=UPI001F1EFCF1|nr:cupin domain-containing protein [Pseudomonas sp. KNUC1026]UFH48681.1 cupin domain-containing protein [Pseudomonas sp. KNUC1026]